MKISNGKEKILVLQAIAFFIIVVVSFTCSATAQALLQSGDKASDFSLKDMQGKEVSLSQFSQKKAVAIVFWSSWSANSPKALKRFEEFYKNYKDKGIQVIGINADNQTISEEDMGKISKLTKELDITFPILLDKNLKTFHEYNIIALPSIMVVTEGKISYELPGFPLVGTEDMFDFLRVQSGEAPRKQMEAKYKPRHDAIADASLARQFVKKKMYTMAYPLFLKAIEKDGKYILPYIELARLYELEGKKLEAEETLRKVLLVEPNSVVILSELGYFLSKAGKTKEAIEVLSKAVKMNSYTPAHYYYAYALAKDGKFKESLAAFDESILLNPFDSMIYSLRGEVYEKNSMLKEASSDYKKALELILKIKN